MKTVKIGILGLGTVGSGTVNVLARNAEEIQRRTGCRIEVTHAAVRSLESSRACDVTGIALSIDPVAVATQPDIDIIVELMGGETLAKDAILAAIDHGKHVVTANKALIALHGNEIFARAKAKGVLVAYEASVAGGIPIVKSIREGLTANRIEWLAGIINGTGNYILTEMKDHGTDFNVVLTEAQRLGYAEADPTFDVEGIDAAHKLTILASIAFGIPLQFEKVFTEGISKITPEDIEYAEELGYRIKSLGIARNTGDAIELRVHPTLVPEKHILASVDGVMNAVMVKGDAVGPTLYCGAGAGAEPTASAVVADIVDVVRAIVVDGSQTVPYLAFQLDALSNAPVACIEEVETAYYLRIHAKDEPGVMARLTEIIAGAGISIEAIIQKEPDDNESYVSVIMLTSEIKEAVMNMALAKIEALPSIDGPVTRIRVEQLQ